METPNITSNPFIVRYETENRNKEMHSFDRNFYRGDLTLAEHYEMAHSNFLNELNDHVKMIQLGVYRWAKVQMISPFGDVMHSMTLINDTIKP